MVPEVLDLPTEFNYQEEIPCKSSPFLDTENSGRLVPTHKTWRDNQERAEVGDVGHDSQRPSQLLCKVDRLLKNQGCLDLRAHWTGRCNLSCAKRKEK